MFLLSIFLISTAFNIVLWQEDFTKGPQTMAQLYDYSVHISYHDSDKVVLQGNPKMEGFSSAWFYLDKDIIFTENDTLEILLKVKHNKARINYYYRKENYPVYFGGEVIVPSDKEWQTVKIPFCSAKPFFSSNFPFALTPHTLPALYLFIDNLLPGYFEVEIDRILVRDAPLDN